MYKARMTLKEFHNNLALRSQTYHAYGSTLLRWMLGDTTNNADTYDVEGSTQLGLAVGELQHPRQH